MKTFAEKYDEYLATDSKKSSMRLAFFWMVKSALTLSFITVIFEFISSIMDKDFNLGAAAGLIGLMLATAFGGKTGQSFAERETPPKE